GGISRIGGEGGQEKEGRPADVAKVSTPAPCVCIRRNVILRALIRRKSFSASGARKRRHPENPQVKRDGPALPRGIGQSAAPGYGASTGDGARLSRHLRANRSNRRSGTAPGNWHPPIY